VVLLPFTAVSFVLSLSFLLSCLPGNIANHCQSFFGRNFRSFPLSRFYLAFPSAVHVSNTITLVFAISLIPCIVRDFLGSSPLQPYSVRHSCIHTCTVSRHSCTPGAPYYVCTFCSSFLLLSVVLHPTCLFWATTQGPPAFSCASAAWYSARPQAWPVNHARCEHFPVPLTSPAGEGG
jgi:hypothetical protein